MSFQFVIDNAAEISITRRPVIGQTLTRSNVVRSVVRDNSIWRFDVTLPDGPRWTDYRSAISLIEQLDRTTVDTISFSNPGHDWFIQYQGDLANPNLIEVNVNLSEGNSVNIVSTPAITSGFLFRAGDIIQLDKCYTVRADVPFNATSIPLHRSLLNEPSGTRTISVGPQCEWRVQCIEFPTWTLFARDQVSWSGAFRFIEADLIPGGA